MMIALDITERQYLANPVAALLGSVVEHDVADTFFQRRRPATAFCDPHKNLSVKYQLFAVMATHLSQTMGVLGELDICHPMACRVCLESQFLAGHVYLS